MMQMQQNANENNAIKQNAKMTKCKYIKMQIRQNAKGQNANTTKCKQEKMQIGHNANET